MTKWNEPKDIRAEKGAGEYPNYYIHRSPSGHTMMLDDTDGHESVTLEHRTGSMLQMRPDGTVHLRTNGDKYDIVLGQHNVKITGEQNIVVDGGGSLLVQGDYDVTVNGDMNTTVTGNQKNTIGGSQDNIILGNQSVGVKGNQNIAINGNQESLVDGTSVTIADGGIAMESTSGALSMKSALSTGIEAVGALAMVSTQLMRITSGDTMSLYSVGNMDQTAPRIDLNKG